MMKSRYKYYIRITVTEGADKSALVSNVLYYLEKNPTLHPQTWGFGEVCRSQYTETTANQLASLVCVDELVIKRKEKTPLMLDFELGYDRQTVHKDRNKINVSIGKQIAAEQLEQMFMFLVESCHPTYAVACGEQEWFDDHVFTWRKSGEESVQDEFTKLVGVDDPSKLPGLYWRNYLSRETWSEMNLDPVFCELDKINAVSQTDDGYLICPFDRPEEIGSDYALARQDRIKSIIGYDHFFKKSDWSVLVNPRGLIGTYIMSSSDS